MKKLYTLIATILLTTSTFAQNHQAFNYQAVVRNAGGEILQEQPVNFKISILAGSGTGTAVYVESHSIVTNEFGLVNLKIGGGTELDGIFNEIDWSASPYFVKVEMDAEGGTNYAHMGTSQLLSVPYALHAKTAENTFSGSYTDLTEKPDLTNELQTLSISNDTIYLSNGGFVKLPVEFSGDYNSLVNKPDLTSFLTEEIDGDATNELQALSISNDTIYLSNGGFVKLPITEEIDGDATNELQTLSISNDTIYLSNGGFAKLPAEFSGSYTDLTNKPVADAITDAGSGKVITEPERNMLNLVLQSLNVSQTGDTLYMPDGNWIVMPGISDANNVDSRDNKTYKTVKIGSQTWMAENLAYLPSVSPLTNYSETDPYYYVYGYEGTDVTEAKATDNYKTYGVLYNWTAAMNGAASSDSNPSNVQGACPNNWHLPSDAEWKQLGIYLGISEEDVDNIEYIGTNQGSKLAGNANLWKDGDLEKNPAFGESGFAAIPGGYCVGEGYDFQYISESAIWWRATEHETDNTMVAYYLFLDYSYSNLYNDYFYKDAGFSVRCIKNIERPIVTTTPISDITTTTAASGGDIIDKGETGITERGVCWNLRPNPTVANAKTTDGTGDGSFTSEITGLITGRTYYVRAYAINSTDTIYGNETTFSSLQADSRDDKIYKTVKIGDQTWMAENLAYLPSVSPSSTESQIQPYYYVYGYEGTDAAAAKETDNYKTYGVLYNWPAAMNGAVSSDNNPSGVQGICPDKWHLPSQTEWTQLKNYLIDNDYGYMGSADYIAKSLAASSGWETYDFDGTVGNNQGTNNNSKFTGMPGGYFINKAFGGVGELGYWWSSTERYASKAYYMCIGKFFDYLLGYPYDGDEERGFSVRCVRDKEQTLITTTSISNITATSATSGGNITKEGEAEITARGICWATTQNPIITDAKTTGGSGIGSFTSNLTNLQPNTTYYVRAYATNSVGTTYGSEVSFTTSILYLTFTDSRDDKTYKAIEIGSQTWMAENLSYLPSVSPGANGSETQPYYYVYDYEGTNITEAKATDNYISNGVLYNWTATMNSDASSNTNPSGVQGVCPDGWHLPSSTEWTELIDYLGGGDVAGGKMKEVGTTHWVSPNAGATNESGFTAVSTGYRSSADGSFRAGGEFATFWASTEYSGTGANSCHLTTHFASATPGGVSNKETGYPVRCLKDN